jgi:molybdopterin-guanine dinucleotide biosynthesis protein A
VADGGETARFSPSSTGTTCEVSFDADAPMGWIPFFNINTPEDLRAAEKTDALR